MTSLCVFELQLGQKANNSLAQRVNSQDLTNKKYFPEDAEDDA